MMTSCCAFGSLSKITFDIRSGSNMNQYDFPRPLVRNFETSSRRNEMRQVERAATQRGKLRVDLDQRRIRVDLELERAVGALLDVGCEPAAQPVAKIALVDRPAGKLVGNLERGRLGVGARSHERKRNGGE